jgi:hypothetical protein
MQPLYASALNKEKRGKKLDKGRERKRIFETLNLKGWRRSYIGLTGTSRKEVPAISLVIISKAWNYKKKKEEGREREK